MEEDNSLLLNVSEGEMPQTKKNKLKFNNNQKQRIRKRQRKKFFDLSVANRKARKELGLTKSKEKGGSQKRKSQPIRAEETEDSPVIKKPRETTTSSTKESPAVGKKTGSAVSGKKQNVISSLFNRNPEIPRLASVDVQQTEEQVFSESKFSQLPIHPHLVSCLDRMCVSEMTEVQQRAIPQLLAGKDLLIKSQTGSGKTLSYAVPLIQSLRSKQERIRRSDGLYAVVLVPTRELALQSLAVIKKLVQSCIWIVPGLVIGGESRKSEKARLRKGVNILVATPGRLVDHCSSTNSLSFSRLHHLIIDEADRLLDMGFEKDVSQIMACIEMQRTSQSKHQTALLSATLSADVKRLAGVTLTDPVTVDVSSTEGQSLTDSSVDGTYALPSSLKQYYVITPGKLRLVTLAALLLQKCKQSSSAHKLIVFLPSQEMVQFYYQLFQGTINCDARADNSLDLSDEECAEFFDVFALHGDMEQKYRSEVYKRFAGSKSGVLLCTDVAARGLDIQNVDWIVQLSPPATTEDYVHRVGRTARIGVTGNSLLFLLPSEVKYLDVLNTAKISVQALEVNNILKACKQESDTLPRKKGSRQPPGTIQEAATALQQSLEEWTYADPDRLAQAKSAYQSFVRAYTTYPTKVKYIFHIKHLHLGHLAKSFCLREAPAGMTDTSTSRKLDKRSKAAKKAELARSAKKRKYEQISEFASG